MSAIARRSAWTFAGSNGSPTFVLSTERMRSVGMWAFPVTETATTVGAAGAEYAGGVTRARNANTASTKRDVRRSRWIKRETSFGKAPGAVGDRRAA